MNINVHKLLVKIEEQLKEAKGSQLESRIRERVYAIKSICEIILEDAPDQRGLIQNLVSSYNSNPVPKVESTSIQSKPIEMNNEANGDSLLDF